MPERDAPIGGVIGIRPIGGEGRRKVSDERPARPRNKAQGRDSVSISLKARHLSGVEAGLEEEGTDRRDNGNGEEESKID